MSGCESKTLKSQDNRCQQCPVLGNPVSFSYCRAPGRELPCGRIFDCWWQAFDVEHFIRSHFSDQTIQTILAPRKGKTNSLVGRIQQAQQRAAKAEKGA